MIRNIEQRLVSFSRLPSPENHNKKRCFQAIDCCSFSFVKARQEIRHTLCVLCVKRLLSERGAIWINCVCDHFLARGGASHYTERVTLRESLWCAYYARVSALLHWPLEKMHTEVSVSQPWPEASNLTQRLYDNVLTNIFLKSLNIQCLKIVMIIFTRAQHSQCRFYGILSFHLIANRMWKMHHNNLLWQTLY